jgi:uncharacterized protein (DUF924 family)
MLGAVNLDAAAGALLDCWFGALDDGFAAESARKRWFEVSAAFDDELRSRFGTLPAAARTGALHTWSATPRGRLALVLVCDQLPRNLFRGSPEAFAYDQFALATAREGVRIGIDAGLAIDERAFLYLPFEHSETLEDQDRSVALFSALRDATPNVRRAVTNDYLNHAEHHRDIVRRFGRFPHRNALLGRESTAEELEYLRRAGNFGQAPAHSTSQESRN